MPSRIDIIGQNGNDGLHYCPHETLIPIRTQQLRICADCGRHFPWELGGRKPVGWNCDKEAGSYSGSVLDDMKSDW